MGYSYSKNKKTGITYVYEIVESHYDPSTKQTRNKKVLVGKLDPVTNKVVKTGARGPKPKNATLPEGTVSDDYAALYATTLAAKNEVVEKLKTSEDEKASLQSLLQSSYKAWEAVEAEAQRNMSLLKQAMLQY